MILSAVTVILTLILGARGLLVITRFDRRLAGVSEKVDRLHAERGNVPVGLTRRRMGPKPQSDKTDEQGGKSRRR